ncbi:CNP1-like family protein [Thiocapsa sp.]|uniref:CNP1-like family protein n=1 Tax=Thiocapsa sp. TaxID=2024551 RepID=UPI0025E54E49|nr:CNP1-like family protein [Thiocapsa sp.]
MASTSFRPVVLAETPSFPVIHLMTRPRQLPLVPLPRPVFAGRTLLWLLLLCFAISASAAENAFVNDAEPPVPSSVRPGTPWKEADTALPPWPKDADLVELVPDGPDAAMRYFIDTANLNVGTDDVVRYTLVAEGRTGARNLSFEGIRCTPRGAYKIYAYGAGERFVPIESEEWLPLPAHGGERWRHDLWRFHFCIPQAFAPRPKIDMVRSLKGRISPRQNMGFLPD